MKKFLVIGNPIEHSLSPKLHNFWFKKNNIDASYEKIKLEENDIEKIVSEVRSGKISGLNITVPFKKTIIPYIDKLSPLAEASQSVNTICKENNIIIGHNTDISGFELSLKHINYELKNKKVLVLGSGGVTSSIIIALKKMGVSKIIISNRTKQKAESLKKINPTLEVIDWGEIPDFDIIINTTSLGLSNKEEIKIDYSKVGKNKLFYDLIYNPKQTNFLLNAKKSGNQTENGKMMFIYQAYQAFAIWHKFFPNINDEVIKLLD